MITLTLDWREVLWWMEGGMAGSHLRWSVYEDMVNKVWPQCSEQERQNMWLIMRRDLGLHWRKHWQGVDFDKPGEGEWRDDITDKTPWKQFRQVLARFNPNNQFAVTIEAKTDEELEVSLNGLSKPVIISTPTLMLSADGTRYGWRRDKPLTVRAYGWRDLRGNDAYFIDWLRRCDPDRIIKAEKLDIPDDGTM